MEELLIKYLAVGKTQPEIVAIFKAERIEPSSLSSIEKALKKIKKEHNAKTMFHLGVILSKNLTSQTNMNHDAKK